MRASRRHASRTPAAAPSIARWFRKDGAPASGRGQRSSPGPYRTRTARPCGPSLSAPLFFGESLGEQLCRDFVQGFSLCISQLLDLLDQVTMQLDRIGNQAEFLVAPALFALVDG